MCCLCLVSERSFLRDPQPFLKKEKKKSKKVKKRHLPSCGVNVTSEFRDFGLDMDVETSMD